MYRLLFPLFIVYLASPLSAQNFNATEYQYKAIYELNYQTDSLNPASASSESMVLYFNNSRSKFSSVGKHIKDSLFNSYENRSMENYFDFQSKAPSAHYKYEIFKDIPNNTLYFTEKVSGNKLMFKQSLNDVQWKLENATSSIAGYDVRKATGSFAGRDYIAWYTEEVPVPDGPYKFGGLPGLILKIGDVQEYYVFTLTSFQQLKEPIKHSLDIDNYLMTTRRKFLQAQKAFDQDPLGALERSGITFGFQSSDQKEILMKRHRKDSRKFNNPIELE